MKRSRTTILLPLICLALLAPAARSAVLGAPSPACVGAGVGATLDDVSRSADGEGIPAVWGDRVVWVGDHGPLALRELQGAAGVMLRHAAAAPDRGLAYVEDGNGDDAVVVASDTGVRRLAIDGEVTHPAWSPDGALAYVVDMTRIEIRLPDGSIRTYTRPAGTRGVFSPVFAGEGSIVAVVEEPASGQHDDTLDNLYGLDLADGTWSRRTVFQVSEDRWSTIRTPVLQDDGGILFVRAEGRSSATSGPSFSLWRMGEAVEKVRDLPAEGYLAAAGGDSLVWNLFAGGEWHLYRETAGGLRDLGCGAVMVDPRTQPDPDKAPDDEAPPANSVGEGVTGGAMRMAIGVGDFATSTEAEAFAEGLAILGAVVIDHGTAPFAVAPGAHGVAVPLAEGADLMASLETFRERFPAYAQRSWIVTLAHGAY